MDSEKEKVEMTQEEFDRLKALDGPNPRMCKGPACSYQQEHNGQIFTKDRFLISIMSKKLFALVVTTGMVVFLGVFVIHLAFNPLPPEVLDGVVIANPIYKVIIILGAIVCIAWAITLVSFIWGSAIETAVSKANISADFKANLGANADLTKLLSKQG